VLHPIDILDAGTGSLATTLVDPNLQLINPVNVPHPSLDVILTGSSGHLYCWRPEVPSSPATHFCCCSRSLLQTRRCRCTCGTCGNSTGTSSPRLYPPATSLSRRFPPQHLATCTACGQNFTAPRHRGCVWRLSITWPVELDARHVLACVLHAWLQLARASHHFCRGLGFFVGATFYSGAHILTNCCNAVQEAEEEEDDISVVVPLPVEGGMSSHSASLPDAAVGTCPRRGQQVRGSRLFSVYDVESEGKKVKKKGGK
jgi:hypothetical protein